MKDKLIGLIDVKSIITIVLTIVFSILTITKVIDGEKFFIVYQMIIVFYFGTQVGKTIASNKEE